MPTEYEQYEWWNGSAWINAETFIAHTDADSFTFTNAQWGDTTDTYELSIAVMDSMEEPSGYSNVVTLNPYEWWNGTTWVDIETSIAHTDQDSIPIPASTYAVGGIYHVQVEVWDTGELSSGYSNERWFQVVTPSVTLSPSGIGSGEAFGVASVTPGPVSLMPGAIVSQEVVAAPSLTTSILVTVSSIASAEAVSSPLVYQYILIQPSGIGSTEALGAPTVGVGPVSLQPSGLLSAEEFGVPTLSSKIDLSIVGIGSLEAVGLPAIVAGPVTLGPSAIASGEAWGLPTLLPQPVTIIVDSIASAEALGTPLLHASIALSPSGVGSIEAFGTPLVIPGVVILSVSGILSAETFGIPFIRPPAYDWTWTGTIDVPGKFRMARSGHILLLNTSGDIILLTVGNPPGGLELLD